MMRDQQAVLRCLQSSDPPPVSAACGGIFTSLNFWVAHTLLFVKQEGLLTEVTNSQTCFPSLVTLDMGHVCATYREEKLGMSKITWINYFTSSGHFLQTFSYGRVKKDLNLCSLAATHFLLCPNLVPDPFFKGISGKVLSKLAASFCILVILRKKNSTKCLTKKSTLAFGALLFGYRGRTRYQASVILVLWALISPFYLH